MKAILTIILTFFYQASLSQIINSISPDESGMYYYSIDTLLSKFKDKNLDHVAIFADSQIIRDFPDNINGLSIVKLDKKDGLNVKRLSSNDVVLSIVSLTIIRDQVSILIGAIQKQGKHMTLYANGYYIFDFIYKPDTRTYELSKIKEWIYE